MKAHIAYLRYVLRHKWFVFLACRQLHVPLIRAILHDWDKFLPDEWFPYVHTFYAPDGSKQYIESPAFAQAWNIHQKRNKHHWQHWLNCNTVTTDSASSKEYCQCLAQNKNSLSSANNADMNAPEKILSMVKWCAIFVENIIKNITAQKCDDKITNLRHLSKSKSFMNIDANSKNVLENNQDAESLNTTVEIRPAVLAVARKLMNFWYWIILMAEEITIAKKQPKALEDDKPTTGQFATTSLLSSESSAIIAIQHSATMVTVPIRKTRILVWDRGDAKCLNCGKPFPLDSLTALPMPIVHIREMVADWIGAGQAITGATTPRVWYKQNYSRMILHPSTRATVEILLARLPD